MAAHAQLSPSSAERWMVCPGSVALCKDLPDESSDYADEGTDAHELAAACLQTEADAKQFAGQRMDKGAIVSQEMVLAIQDYVDYVRGVVTSTNGTLLVEQRLPISAITGEADAHGTSDAAILANDELIVIDLKYGRGVQVQAQDNPQLQMYALAALRQFELAHDIRTVRMVIHQPRLGVVSEWVQTVAQLESFGGAVLLAAAATRNTDAPLVPSTKGCRWCRAKANCPAIRAEVMGAFDTVQAATATPDELSFAMGKVDLMEGWSKAIRAKVESCLLAHTPVQGWKLVQGKRGNRAWSSKEDAEALLKAMRVPHDQMYDYALVSPTGADKLAQANVIGPRQWPKVQALITQSEGKPSVAPESDKRPALLMSAVAGDFDDMSICATDLS